MQEKVSVRDLRDYLLKKCEEIHQKMQIEYKNGNIERIEELKKDMEKTYEMHDVVVKIFKEYLEYQISLIRV